MLVLILYCHWSDTVLVLCIPGTGTGYWYWYWCLRLCWAVINVLILYGTVLYHIVLYCTVLSGGTELVLVLCNGTVLYCTGGGISWYWNWYSVMLMYAADRDFFQRTSDSEDFGVFGSLKFPFTQ